MMPPCGIRMTMFVQAGVEAAYQRGKMDFNSPDLQYSEAFARKVGKAYVIKAHSKARSATLKSYFIILNQEI